MKQREIKVDVNNRAKFHNAVDYCVGTGRMGLALQKEYLDQLELVQKHIGFKHIRGHGLFCDDMAIYQVNEDGVVEYNYTYLDRVMDSYVKLGLVPFIELGFMPYKMASGTQTVFYWKGNTTPPKDYDEWTKMVVELLKHLKGRYGEEEVVTWPIEVWNEPNLPGFWEKADMQEYFKLFHKTFTAIKAYDKRFRVGGPAVCGGTDEVWIKAFMEYCHDNKLAVDFVTRHHYTTELPEKVGHYGYVDLMVAEAGFENLHTTREIIDSFPEYKGLEIHITEFNTSYIPNAPIHDTNQNAAFIAEQLSRLGDDNESYSYWTFGDVFEELGVPFTQFHGGFGLVANGCIPKPTFWTFAFYKQLKEKAGDCVYKDDSTVIMRYADGSYRGIVWNKAVTEDADDYTVTLELPDVKEGVLLTKTVSEECCNPLKVWHDIGEPFTPTEAENELIRAAAYPLIGTKRFAAADGTIKEEIKVAKQSVIYFEYKNNTIVSDTGYDYDRAKESKTRV